MRAFRVQEIAGGFEGSEDKGWLTKHGDANHVACNPEDLEMHGLWIDEPSHTILRGPGMELEPLFVRRNLERDSKERESAGSGKGANGRSDEDDDESDGKEGESSVDEGVGARANK